MPVTALKNSQTDNLNKKAALVALNPAVANVGSAVAALGSLAANGDGLVAYVTSMGDEFDVYATPVSCATR